MDDARRGRSGLSVGVDVGHHVVVDLFFPGGSEVEVNILDMLPQRRHLFLGHRQAQRMLRGGKLRPELPPGLDAPALGEQPKHLVGSVAGG